MQRTKVYLAVKAAIGEIRRLHYIKDHRLLEVKRVRTSVD